MNELLLALIFELPISIPEPLSPLLLGVGLVSISVLGRVMRKRGRSTRRT